MNKKNQLFRLFPNAFVNQPYPQTDQGYYPEIVHEIEKPERLFRQPLHEELEPYMAEGYNFFNGIYYRGSYEYISALPAGSMSGTAEDMANFMIAHLQEGRYGDVRILEESTVREMHSRQFTQHPEQDGMPEPLIIKHYDQTSKGNDSSPIKTQREALLRGI